MSKLYGTLITADSIKKFYDRVQFIPFHECWEWTAGINNGYGSITVQKRTFLAHRFSFFIHNGFLEKNLFVCHSCDNPTCVNPNHLWQGTHKENMRDAKKKGRLYIPPIKLMCVNGHIRSEENIWIHKKTGKRHCRRCAEIRRHRNINKKNYGTNQINSSAK